MAEAKETVLIVEDDKFLLDMYVLKLGERGYKIVTASSGSEAIEKLSAGDLKPDIMLLDLVMPGMGGFEMLESIREKKLLEDATTVIILSNLGQKEDIERGKSLGADGYIVKASATPTEVVDRIAEIVKNKNKKE